MKILFNLCLILLLMSCNQSRRKNSDLDNNKNSDLNNNEKMEAVYYSIPSPMETTIILKRSYSKFSSLPRSKDGHPVPESNLYLDS